MRSLVIGGRFATMRLENQYLFYAMWIAWGAYWIASARDLKSPLRQESRLSRWAHFGPLILCGYLLSDGGRSWQPLALAFMVRRGLPSVFAARRCAHSVCALTFANHGPAAGQRDPKKDSTAATVVSGASSISQ